MISGKSEEGLRLTGSKMIDEKLIELFDEGQFIQRTRDLWFLSCFE